MLRELKPELELELAGTDANTDGGDGFGKMSIPTKHKKTCLKILISAHRTRKKPSLQAALAASFGIHKTSLWR